MNGRAIITGITGQDGAYLSKFLQGKGYKIFGVVRDKAKADLRKLNYVKTLTGIEIIECDLTSLNNVNTLIKAVSPSEMYHLSAQSSVGASFNDPHLTLSYNYISTLNLLESIRKVDNGIKYFQASSSEIYGEPQSLPINENHTIQPINPYGISKACTYLTTRLYRDVYRIFACNGILFNHESYLRDENFFIKKVIKTAIQIANGEKDNLKVGNINLKRDFGYAPAYVEAMWLLLQHSSPKDIIISSGQSVSLNQIIAYIFDKLSISHDKLILDNSLFRPAEVVDIYGDNTKAKNELGWNYSLDFFEVLDILLEEEIFNLEKN